MVTNTMRSRARGCLLGLAVGDALGGPTEGKTRQEIVRLWSRVTDFMNETQGGSDDTEYALFNAKLLLWHGPALTPQRIAEAWKKAIVDVANTHQGAGFSEMMAIRNLRSGRMPPASGYHAHAWSDGVAMRVAPIGIVAAGRPEIAARLAAMDGSVTHSGEGIIAGQAVAAAVARAITGASVSGIVDAARGAIPLDSWTRRSIDRAVDIGSGIPGMWEALTPLYDTLVCTPYFWSDIAPEAVGLAFGVFTAARGDFRESVLGGANVGRDTDTIAAIAGAIAGARSGVDAIPSSWRKRIGVARGTCLKTVEGIDIEQIADQLADLAGRWTV
jgi:ADP-ribosylglycohydrolase